MPELPILGHGQAATQLRSGMSLLHGWVFIAAMLATWVGTGWARHYALRRSLIDAPDDPRRNHQVATPRGGGIAMATVMVLVAIALAASSAQTMNAWWVVATSLGVVSGIGWWDDHHALPVALRLFAHAIAAMGVPVAGAMLGWPAWVGLSGALLALVLTNIWNFMDGIDGIAASQACLVALVIAALSSHPWQSFQLALAGVSLGFLLWNFPKARIFMGDVGSGLLGLVLAWGWAAATARQPTAGLLILFVLAPFLVDSSLTLGLRMLRRERWWEAHSSHSYQIAARRTGRHPPVTWGYLAVTVAAASGAMAMSLLHARPGFILPCLLAWYTACAGGWWALRRWRANESDGAVP